MLVSCKVLGLQGLLRRSAAGSTVMGLQQAKRALWGLGTRVALHGQSDTSDSLQHPGFLCQTSVGIWALQLSGV